MNILEKIHEKENEFLSLNVMEVYLIVRYTRESLPLHPPIRRIFSFNQNK
jgi:hypothetical protein